MFAANTSDPTAIEGYTDRLSYTTGETASFHISSRFESYRVTIRRIGAEKETVWAKTISGGRRYPVPSDASPNGCDWPVAFRVLIPDQWKSGYYEVYLGTEDPKDQRNWIEGRTIFFVVRGKQTGKNNSVLLTLSTNTYNAYNNWGGSSLYGYNSRNQEPAKQVSFHRPIPSGAWEWEIPFIEWAERNGYFLDYAVNYDLQRIPGLLNPYLLFISVGHDEYWSRPMRDQVEKHLNRGGHAAFFGGNNLTWQVRFEDRGKTMVGWKEDYKNDPVYKSKGPSPLLSTLWRHPLVGRPENMLTGVGFLHGGMHRGGGQYPDGSGAFTVYKPKHWVFGNTGLSELDQFGGTHKIVGYETDGCDYRFQEGTPVPTYSDGTPENFEILALAPARWRPEEWDWYEDWYPGREGNACLGVYTRSSGGTVFTASTTGWSHGLRGGDSTVEQITRNVLDRLGEMSDSP